MSLFKMKKKLTLWGLPESSNGWLVCRTKADLIQAVTPAGMGEHMWEEVAQEKTLPCFVTWIYNANGDPEFITMLLQDAKELLAVSGR